MAGTDAGTRRRRQLAWAMLAFGVVGMLVTVPMWLLNIISDRTIIGLTLFLSWVALQYPAVAALWAA